MNFEKKVRPTFGSIAILSIKLFSGFFILSMLQFSLVTHGTLPSFKPKRWAIFLWTLLTFSESQSLKNFINSILKTYNINEDANFNKA